MKIKRDSGKIKSAAIMQPYLFPYIGYFQLIKAVDIFVIYDDVNYINKGFINRNFILLNGQPHKITLSLCCASQNKLINGISIGDNAPKILKTIELAYKRAPYFHDTFMLLKSILEQKETNLAKFVGNSLKMISDYLELKTKFIYSNEIINESTLKGQYKIIDICKKLEINRYINAIGGEKLYDKRAFKKQNMDLLFIKSLPQQYIQFNATFSPNLSIIDIMMFNERSHVLRMMEQYELF